MQFTMFDSGNMPQQVHLIWEKETVPEEYQQAPDKMQDGYWPSLDKDDDGYIGDKTDDDELDAEYAKARKRFNDWENGIWYYVGVVAKLTIYIPSGGTSFHVLTVQSAGLWGIESDSGEYLDDVYQEQKAELKSELDTLAEALSGGTVIEKESE